MCKFCDNKSINSQPAERTIYAVHITRNKKIVFKFKMKPPADTDLNALRIKKKIHFPEDYRIVIRGKRRQL